MPLSVALIVSIFGGLWRVVLGGANKWASWSQDIPWLRWCWDFTHEGGEPVLRRSVIMTVCPLLTAPVWFSTTPWWCALVLTVAAVVQWVWPGRNFAVWWSLLGAHGLWGVVSATALYISGGVWWFPLIPPFVCILSYRFKKDDRIGQAATGAAVFGCLTLSVW